METIKNKKKKSNKTIKCKKLINLKVNNSNNIKMIGGNNKDYKDEYINILKELEFYNRVFEKNRIKAQKYKEAVEKIEKINEALVSSNQIKNLAGIGKAMIEKLEELIKTGKVKNLENLKNKYENEYKKELEIEKKKEIFTNIYGIGEKKAEELIEKNIETIEDLELRQNELQKNKKALLNEKQKIGLKYYRPLLKRIPREEIEEYKLNLTELFNETIKENNSKEEDNKFEIVGSYRRGKENSGDIDIIITSKNNDDKVYNKFIEKLQEKGILIELLSNGKIKSLTIGKLPKENAIARRLDFLYSPPDEYAFAILYFTGSKEFNTAMRQHALNNDLTLNEHGFHKIKDRMKEDKVNDKIFNTEKDIFDYLNLEYKEPSERIDENSIIILSNKEKDEDEDEDEDLSEKAIKMSAHDKTIKKKVPKTNKTLKKNKKDIIENLEKFKKEGISVLYSISEDELTEMLKESIERYYNNKSDEILNDNEYDILREYVLKKYPENKTAKEQHTELKLNKNKVKLPYEMFSMDKIKADTKELEKFKKKYKGPYVISCKLDGVSALYSTENSSEKLYTRGNGIYGQSIDHLIPHLNLPKEKNQRKII